MIFTTLTQDVDYRTRVDSRGAQKEYRKTKVQVFRFSRKYDENNFA